MVLTKATSSMILGDVINVLDYIPEAEHAAIQAGTSTYDAAANITSAITAAAGNKLFWSKGTYLTNSSISNLHTIRHLGPGKIKRGADVFVVNPEDSDTNIIYLAATGGSDTNDGLSSSEAFATLQAAINILLNYGGVLTGNWRFSLAAGTYTEDGIAVPNLMYSNNPIEVRGPDVGGHPNTPTAIISGSGGSAGGFSANRKCEVKLKDIKFTTFGARTAIRFSQMTDGECDNVHIDGAGKGVAVDEQSKVRIKGGLLDNCSLAAVDLRDSDASVGLVNSFDGPTIGSIGSCTLGVAVLGMTDAHVDDLVITNCTGSGIQSSENSRATLNGVVDLQNNGVALERREGGIIELFGTIDFNDNTVNANTVNEKNFGSILSGGALPLLHRVTVSTPTFVSHTGNTTETTLYTGTDFFRSNTYVFSGRSCNIILDHKKTGSLATATLRFKAGTNVMATVTIPATAAEGRTEVRMVARGVNTQRVHIRSEDTNGLIAGPDYANTSFTLDDTVGDLDLTITIQLGNTGDTFERVNVEIFDIG